MTYEEIKALIKKVITFPKADMVLISDIADATRSALGADFADKYVASSDAEYDYETNTWHSRSYNVGRLIETAILEVAKTEGYIRGNEDYFGFNPERDFSNILLSQHAAKKPYVKWPKGKFTEIPNGVERERLIKKIVESVGPVEIPVDQRKLEARIREVMLQETGYLYTWNVLRGWEVLISPHTQRVFEMNVIMYAAEWTLFRRTGLKEIPTTDPRCTIVVEE